MCVRVYVCKEPVGGVYKEGDSVKDGPSLISLMVSVDGKLHAYLLTGWNSLPADLRNAPSLRQALDLS